MWVGIGCGALFLLSAIGGGIAMYMAKKAADNALAALSAAAAPLAPPNSPGATPSDAKPDDGAKDSAGSPVGGACAKAAECCRKIVQKSNAGAQAEAGCLAMKQLTEATCQQPLQTYQQSAKLLGVSCD
jgi:hypothetical protein